MSPESSSKSNAANGDLEVGLDGEPFDFTGDAGRDVASFVGDANGDPARAEISPSSSALAGDERLSWLLDGEAGAAAAAGAGAAGVSAHGSASML